MSEKSHVSMENKVCPVCGKQHDYDCALLLDKRLRKSMESTTVTGYGLCKEHAEQFDAGYILLIGIDPNKSVIKNDAKSPTGASSTQEGMYRTGDIAAIRPQAWTAIFNQPLPESRIVCVDYHVIAVLQKLEAEAKSKE